MDKQFLEDYKRNKESIERYMPKEVIARLLGKQDEALKHKYNRILKQHNELGDKMNSGVYTGMKLDEAVWTYRKMGLELDGIIKELQDMGEVVSDMQVEYGF